MPFIIETTPGVFVSESKNRFLCYIEINGEITECYVPSSSRIENYLNLGGCEVLVTENNNKKSRTKYSLFAVNYRDRYIILNLNKVNTILESLIINGELYPETNYQVSKEKIKDGYKSDLFLEGEDHSILVEAKGVISKDKIVRFPQVSSARSIVQLKALKELLDQGKIVHYYLVALSPIINKIEIDNKSDYYYHLQRCISKGLFLRGVSITFDGKTVNYSHEIVLN
ncbi:DNA/RNA nuclease SfsA [Bacillus sp. T33-2]|uniref:DNA/RNA nuclease SfsA n=1 Tax=Bacillus sp. T33-2 TaxID=2054168 RepID=UPI0015E0C6A7|nr:DNA/RNA nuclease SfsA [Bacillus sp. T33-2]